MASASLPPGFRFHPTDFELVMYYLRRKVMGIPLPFDVISEIDLYKFSPWDLPERSCLKSNDLESYFFCPRDRKYTNGPRTNRATENGYWKTTGKDRIIRHNSQNVGIKKTLVFHLGRAPLGTRTDWVIHEYILQHKDLADKGIIQDAYVLCKLYEKSGPGPRKGEELGAKFIEEERNGDNDKMNIDSVVSSQLVNPSSSKPIDCQPKEPLISEQTEELTAARSAPQEDNSSLMHFNPSKLLKELSNNNEGFFSHINGLDEKLELTIPNSNIQDHGVPLGGDKVSTGLTAGIQLYQLFFPFGIPSLPISADCQNKDIQKISVNIKKYCEFVLGPFPENGDQAPVDWDGDSSPEHFDPSILIQKLSCGSNVVDHEGQVPRVQDFIEQLAQPLNPSEPVLQKVKVEIN